MVFQRKNRIVAAAACSVFATAALAEEEQTLRKIRVEAEADERGYVALSAAGGTKTDTPLNEIPQAITVITAEQIKDQNASNLQETLRYAPGVRAEVYGLDNRGDWFTLRGGSEASTLQDGLRLPLTGFYGVVRAEPYAFENIEVIRGPSSVIAGQNGPGGVVNLVLKQPKREAAGEVSLQIGNDNRKQLAADFTGPLGDTFAYRVVALANESDTQIRFADEERQYLAPSILWTPSDSFYLRVFGEYQNDRSMNTNAFLPWVGTRLPAPNGPVPTNLFIGEPDWDVYGGKRVRLGYSLEFKFNDNWKLRHQLRHDDVDGKLRSMYAAFYNYTDAPFDFEYGDNALGNDRTIARAWYITDDQGDITNAELLLDGKFNTGPIVHSVLFGVDGLDSSMSQAYLSGDGTDIDVYAPIYGTFPLPELNFDAPVVSDNRQLGVLLQDQLKIDDRFVIVASLRHDEVESETRDDPDSLQKDSAWTKRLGFVYLAGGFSPYVSYSESFEAVAGTDANDNPFKPKRGEQYEAGIKWVSAAGNATASVAAYRLKETNRLSPDPVNIGFSVQLGEVEVSGVELESAFTVGSLELIASYTYTIGTVSASGDPTQDIYVGHRLASLPEHAASVWGVNTFKFGNASLRAGLGVRYVGETWDGTDTLSVPSNTLIDALLALDINSWSLAINASNLADKDYIATCLDRGDCWFGSRREVAATLSFRF